MAKIKAIHPDKGTFEIDDSPESIQAAEAKGYRFAIPMTKNGTDVYDVDMTPESIQAAQAKGYKSVDSMSKTHMQSTKPGMLESAATGASQGMTMGFADELGGALTAGVKQLAGDPRTFGQAYQQERDLLRGDVKTAQQTNPKSFATGEFVGGVAGTPAASTVKGAAALGGLGAAASTFGHQEGDIKPVPVAVSGAMGAVTGGLLQKYSPAVLDYLAKKGGQAKDSLVESTQNKASELAVKALGGTKSQMQNMPANIKQQVGQELLTNKVVTPLASKKAMSERIDQLSNEAAQQIDDVLSKAGNTAMTTDELVQKLTNRAESLQKEGGNKPLIDKFNNYIEDIMATGKDKWTAAELRTFRKNVDRSINFASDAPAQLGAQEVRTIAQEGVLGGLEKVSPELRKEGEQAFKRYSRLAEADKMASKGAAAEATNSTVGPVSKIAGAAQVATGSFPWLTVLNEAVRRYGNASSAVGLNKIANVVGGTKFAPILQKAAERGPGAIVATHQVLLKDPEYQQLIGGE